MIPGQVLCQHKCFCTTCCRDNDFTVEWRKKLTRVERKRATPFSLVPVWLHNPESRTQGLIWLDSFVTPYTVVSGGSKAFSITHKHAVSRNKQHCDKWQLSNLLQIQDCRWLVQRDTPFCQCPTWGWNPFPAGHVSVTERANQLGQRPGYGSGGTLVQAINGGWH